MSRGSVLIDVRDEVLPIGALSTSIGFGASSECVLVVSGGLAEGFGCGLSALIRALSIFGICTRNVRGAHRSMGTGGCRSAVVSCCQSTTGSFCRSMLLRKRLGGCGCLAANSSWVMILTALHDATDSECVVDRCSGKLADRFWLKSVDRCPMSDGLQSREHLSSDLLYYPDDPPGGCRSTVVSCCQSTTGSVCRSMLIHKGLGGCGCLAANSSWVMILTALHDATDSECVVDRCSGKLADRFWLKSVDRCPKSDVDRHQLSIDELASMSIDEERLPLQIKRSKLAGSDENNS
ncbi:hypothetical protein F2Q68_00016907 [Brassica cretica]|uniref:Uncharacterized protein n=1 Tax=Brassica cretica TaxID=69181 RepID=A0A8S9HG61_BRACR|nr:hypothetical protein F2Q68_00016907 [Brassica cretica]